MGVKIVLDNKREKGSWGNPSIAMMFCQASLEVDVSDWPNDQIDKPIVVEIAGT
jgi:hypothetical protein